MTSYARSIYTLSAHQKPTVGDTKMSVQNNDHMGWLKCDGRFVSTKDFYFLFEMIGYSFGGSGSQFQLPNAGGKVPAAVGTFTDSISTTKTFVLGSTIGEYEHILSLTEMPSHNHGVSNILQSSYNNSTSIEFTRISVNVSTTGVYDSGHTHGYVQTQNNNNSNAVSLTTSDNNSGAFAGTTGVGNAVIVDPSHRHSITDPGHSHTLNSAGGDQKHNNIQPTLPIGNMFIYSGLTFYPLNGFPYTLNKTIL